MKRTLKRTTDKDFIAVAGTKASSEPTYPWEDVDPKATQVFNLRLPSSTWEKLKYISENVPFMSMQRYCQEILNPAIDKTIKDLTE